MKNLFVLILIMIYFSSNAQNTMQEELQYLQFGSIKPTGWLKEQMQKDIDGFVGNLDLLVPDLINDPIYGKGRLQKYSKAKDLGNLKSGDAEGDDQYKWWNSETQSNWWDGYLRNVFVLDDSNGIEKVNQYIQNILSTQDDDGYLGIYDKELRYKFNSENGELWSKTTLYRGLLAYYEITKDEKVWNAITKAVDNVMQNYPVNKSNPFNVGKNFSGGVAHGLTFTDVLEKMYQITKDKKYREYALFLYMNFTENYSSEKDVKLENILNKNYKLQSHGVHTYEHLRPLILAAYFSENKNLKKALKIYLERISKSTTLTGGAIGDEWIAERTANATYTGYEYCSLQELLDSYTLLMQKTGDANIGDEIENIFYNAAQGSRNPNHSCIAYLKTDNSYEMLGTKNGEVEPNRKQTRYKYSPAHQDVAVCCSPNAGRISPYFVQSSWMKEGENTLVATLLLPNILQTYVKSTKVVIKNETDYPNKNNFNFKISLEKSLALIIKIRKPNWVKTIKTKEIYTVEKDFITINRRFEKDDNIEISFLADVLIKQDINHEKYFTYGALVFAKEIKHNEILSRTYKEGFNDYNYEPINNLQYEYIEKKDAKYLQGKIIVNLKNKITKKIETIELIPFGRTILRQVSF